MRKSILLFSLVLIVFFTAKSNAQNSTRVLFIGNSITYYNNMPQTFEAIANDKGDTTDVTVYAPGGTGFINHVTDPNVYDKFRQGNWDFVVLQPGSNESPGYSEPKEKTLTRLNILKDSITYYNPCAKILLYEISYGVWGNSQSDLNTYNNTMDLIRSNCEYWADSANIFFAPAGESMRTAWNNDTSTMLWGSTGNVHPNEKGSYLIACSFYASIFQKNSTGTTIINSLTQSEADFYQQLADSIVLNHLSNWRINTYNQFTDFTYSVDKYNVLFNSLSQNIDSLIWNFGDGLTSSIPVTNHTYNQNGKYEVTLTTYKGTCIEMVSKNIVINTVGVNDIINNQINQVYPNPFTNELTVQIRGEANINNIKIYNLIGENLTNLVSFSKSEYSVRINTSRLPNGMYILKTDTFSNIIYKTQGNR